MKEGIRRILLWCFALVSIGVGVFFGPRERAALQEDVPAQAQRADAVRELEKGDTAEATRSTLQALALDPNDASTWALFGEVLERQGRQDDALAAYERATALDGHAFGPFFALARIHSVRGAHEEARQALTRARELEPAHPGAAALGGELAEGRGELARALDLYLEAARASEGRDRAAYLEKAAQLHLAQEDEGRAAKTLLQAAEADPDNPLRWARAAARLAAAGDEEAARAALERQAIAEATPRAWMRVARAHDEAGAEDAAAHARQRAMEACARLVRGGAHDPAACVFITG